jgi:D-proline reductase (dithiol) PrdB
MPPIDYIPRTRQLYSHYAAYRWVENHDAPWTPLTKPLSRSRVVLASSCGVYVKGQTPYHTRDDTSIRLIPKNTPTQDLRIVHFGYRTDDAQKDPNCVFPLERLRELERDGIIGELAGSAYGFMGGIYSARRVREELAPRFVDLVHQQRADLLFMVPA